MARVKNVNQFLNLRGGYAGFQNPGGAVYWVGASGYAAYDGATPSDSNTGLSPQEPFATIQKGLDSCVTGRGDVVALLPGTWTITAALTMTKHDVMLCSAVPLEPLMYSPVIITAAAAYDLNVIQVDANNVTISGIGFECGFTTVTANQEVIQLNSDNATTDIFGAVIENCFFDFTRASGAASAADTDLDGIRVGLDANDAAYNSTVRGCTLRGCDQNAISISVGSNGCLIEGNEIYDGIGSELSTAGVAILALNARIRDNYIKAGVSSDTGGPIGVNVAAAAAHITGNHLVAWGANGVGITIVDTGTMHSSANYINAVAAGNIIDFKVSATTTSSCIDWGNVTNVDPALAALVTATVAGL